MALNFASFTIFISLVVYFDRATREPYYEARISRRFDPVIRALYTSWIFIMVPLFELNSANKIRSVFRIVEFATGWDGPVNTNEKFFYIFDASMMSSPTSAQLISGSQEQEFSSSSSLQGTES